MGKALDEEDGGLTKLAKGSQGHTPYGEYKLDYTRLSGERRPSGVHEASELGFDEHGS
jgi:hypothetical protein